MEVGFWGWGVKPSSSLPPHMVPRKLQFSQVMRLITCEILRKEELKLPRPLHQNHLDDPVDSDQWVVNEYLSLLPYRATQAPVLPGYEVDHVRNPARGVRMRVGERSG